MARKIGFMSMSVGRDEGYGLGFGTMDLYNNVLCTDTFLSDAVRYTSTALAMIGFIVAQV